MVPVENKLCVDSVFLNSPGWMTFKSPDMKKVPPMMRRMMTEDMLD
jgi:hypothetical protein